MDLASRTSSLSTLSSISSTPPRPLKRPAFPSSTTPEPPSKRAKLAANPPTHENEATVSPEMLLALPSHLLKSYPVASPDFVKAVGLSVCALKRVLTLPQSILSPHNEIQALTGLAELAKTCLENDLGGEFGNMLLRDVTAQHLPRALHLAGTHPTLAGFRTHLALLQLSIPPHISNVKHVRNTLKKLLKEDSNATMRYYLYLALVDSYVSEDTVTEGDVNRIASLLEEMREIAREQGDEAVEQFTWILTLRLAMMFELWEDASEAVMKCEDFFAFNFRSPPLPENDGQTSSSDPLAPLSTSSPDHAEKPSSTLPRLLRIQVLMLSVLYHCSMNEGKKTFARLERLHEEMDKGAFGNPDGVIEVPVNSDSQKPIYIKTTPPCLLITLAYLVSADVKRDPIGRPNKIKRRIFAFEGLSTLERARSRGLTGCVTLEEVKKMEKTLGEIKVECIIELVSVGIMRSEFTQAKAKMDELVSTVLTGGEEMWSCYGGRIILLTAQLHHALGTTPPSFTLNCYRVAASWGRNEISRSSSIDAVLSVHTRPQWNMKTPSKMGPFDRSNAPTPSTIFTRTPDYPDTPRRGRDPFETPFRSRVIPNRMGSPVKTASPLKKMMNFGQPDMDDTWVGGGKDDAWLSLVAEVGEVVLRLGLVRTAQCERRGPAPSDSAGGDQEEKREEGRTTRSRSRSRSRSRPPPPTPVVCTSEEASELLWIKEQSALLALQCDELGPGDVKVLGELCKGIHCLCGVGITEAEGLDAKVHMRQLLRLCEISKKEGEQDEDGYPDSWTRALTVAIIASFYVYTADSHLNQMLSLCEMLASGLGAPVKDSSTSTASDAGNVPIRLFTAQTRLSLLRNGKAKGKGVGGKGRVSLEDEPKLIKMVEVFEKRVEEVREFGKSLFLVSDHDEKSADNTDGEDEKRVAALLKH